jgi:hypothetical protein
LDDESLMPKSLNKHGVPDEKNNVWSLWEDDKIMFDLCEKMTGKSKNINIIVSTLNKW